MNVPHDATLPWQWLHRLATLLRMITCRLTVEGSENVPASGGCIIPCNHTTGPDYVFLGYASPRQIFYMAKAEIFSIHPWVAKFFLTFGVFPIRRGQSDLGAIEHAVQLVQSGRVLGMFPEGTRSKNGELRQGRTGIARIAIAAAVPVIPAVVINSIEAQRRLGQFWRRPQVTVKFGKPLHLSGDPTNREETQKATDQVMLAMAALLPEEMQGEWGKLLKEGAG